MLFRVFSQPEMILEEELVSLLVDISVMNDVTNCTLLVRINAII